MGGSNLQLIGRAFDELGATVARPPPSATSIGVRVPRLRRVARIFELDVECVADAADDEQLLLGAERGDGARPAEPAASARRVQVGLGRLRHVEEVDVRALGHVEPARAERRREEQPSRAVAKGAQRLGTRAHRRLLAQYGGRGLLQAAGERDLDLLDGARELEEDDGALNRWRVTPEKEPKRDEAFRSFAHSELVHDLRRCPLVWIGVQEHWPRGTPALLHALSEEMLVLRKRGAHEERLPKRTELAGGRCCRRCFRRRPGRRRCCSAATARAQL
eukprot:6182748-Pleurochrysis_carterae.AAC.1